MINPLDLTGRVMVVTGASAGIGLATAILLSQLGARLVLAARNGERLAAALAQLEGAGHRVEQFDLAVPDEVPAWLKRVSAATGAISGVVHCAGAQVIRPLRVLTGGEIDGLLKLNVNAALMLAKGFRQKGVHAATGSLVLVSSVMGLVGAPGRAAYCASKSALHSMTKALALELAPEGLRVNCVAPGFVRTHMLEQAEATLGAEQLRRVEEMHPLGFGEARDVGSAIAFLLSDMSRWMTGATLVIDGGYTAQ
jgi:NAD(P)-dependent dehydrogenase (short-subunit alcohol dehydrogenase family)